MCAGFCRDSDSKGEVGVEYLHWVAVGRASVLAFEHYYTFSFEHYYEHYCTFSFEHYYTLRGPFSGGRSGDIHITRRHTCSSAQSAPVGSQPARNRYLVSHPVPDPYVSRAVTWAYAFSGLAKCGVIHLEPKLILKGAMAPGSPFLSV